MTNKMIVYDFPELSFIEVGVQRVSSFFNRAFNEIDYYIYCNPDLGINIKSLMLSSQKNSQSLNLTNSKLTKLQNETEFYLYTKETANFPQRIYVNDTKTLKYTRWSPGKKTVLCTTGYSESYNSGACQKIKDGNIFSKLLFKKITKRN